MDSNTEKTSYSLFACIGTGFAGIGLGATLKRWYGIDDIQFFERHSQLGGTWFINQYPGCACDVPSALYSYSFEPNPGWTKIMPTRTELWEYLDGVARKYDLLRRMKFETLVQRCEWIEERTRWRLTVRNLKSGTTYHHESQFLFAATGALVTPRDIDVPGAEIFKGIISHTGRWRPDIDLEGKRVVLFGNGCTASQVVPAIVHKTKSLTQIVRTKHWVFPSIDSDVPEFLRFLLTWLPALRLLQRLIIFCIAENGYRGFPLTSAGAKFRASQRKVSEEYMKAAAPEKYHDMLIPDFEVNCKRRIFDCGYLKSLHAENFTLTNEKALEIVPEGVRTEKGLIEADVIILANGYITNQFVAGVDVVGRAGETLDTRWKSLGGEGAYNTCATNGFPNFFLLLGPNSGTGHTSTVMALENATNYALRVLKPVLEGHASIATVKGDAEERFVNEMQTALQKTVWNTGCGSWYTRHLDDGSNRWNAMSYPYSQGEFWYRSLFPVWSDWEYTGRATSITSIQTQSFSTSHMTVLALLAVFVAWSSLGSGWSHMTTNSLSAAMARPWSFAPSHP